MYRISRRVIVLLAIIILSGITVAVLAVNKLCTAKASKAITTTSAIIKSKNTNDFAVIVKENGLWAVNLSKVNSEVELDKGGTYKNLVVSPDGNNVAYTKDDNLYITAINLNKATKVAVKVSTKVVSYDWASNEILVFATKNSGLSGFNVSTSRSFVYIKGQEHYEGIKGDGKGNVYATELKYYKKNNQSYIEDTGLISYDVNSGKKKLIVASKPANDTDLGLFPVAAGISKNANYVYIWCMVHAGSANTDGVSFGVYDVKNKKFQMFDQKKVFALAYNDNLAVNPVDEHSVVINNGGWREMNINKTLLQLDVESAESKLILPKDLISTSDNMKAKGMVTMTPNFSNDGKKIIFSSSIANEDAVQWMKEPHNIYTVDIDTNKVEKITTGSTFDFAPVYFSSGSQIAFVRKSDSKNELSLWTINGSQEQCIADGIKLDDYDTYYGHINLGNSINIY